MLLLLLEESNDRGNDLAPESLWIALIGDKDEFLYCCDDNYEEK